MATRKPASDDDETVSGPTLARRLGLTPTTVSKLGGDGVLVRVSRGRYALWPSVGGYVEHQRRSASGRESPSAIARVRLLKAQASKVEFENAKARGALVDIHDVESYWSVLLRTLCDELLRLPVVIGGRTPGLPRNVIEMIDTTVREALTRLADSGPAIATDAEARVNEARRRRA